MRAWALAVLVGSAAAEFTCGNLATNAIQRTVTQYFSYSLTPLFENFKVEVLRNPGSQSVEITSPTIMEYTYDLTPGASAILRVTRLDANGNEIAGTTKDCPAFTFQAQAPDPISAIVSVAHDGRHRNFTFEVPRKNGEKIRQFVLRRTLTDGSQPFFYNVSCSAMLVSCEDSYASICWNEAPPCQSTGSNFSIRVGSDLWPEDESYIVPQQQYKWAIIATNKMNDDCFKSGTNGATCGDFGSTTGQGYGSWSPVVTYTQPSASPDRPQTQAIEAKSSTTLQLSWKAPSNTGISGAAPRDNGAAVLMYKTACVDTSTYLTESWRKGEVVQYTPPGADPTADLTTVIQGLQPGTTYSCWVAANNSVGGMEPIFQSPFNATATTHAESPQPVDAVLARCTYSYDDVIAASGKGAPATPGPSMNITVHWNAPRPNAGADNGRGPPFYQFVGDLPGDADDTNFTSPIDSPLLEQSYATPHAPGHYYGYGGTYSFSVRPWATGLFAAPWASFSCTNGGFRPAAPVGTLVQILDRKVIISWTAPDNHGDPIIQYIYQICKGTSCTEADLLPGTDSWDERAHMCANGDIRWGADVCKAAHSGMAPAGQNFDLSLYREGEPLVPETQYTMVLRARNAGPNGAGWTETFDRFGIGWSSPVLTFTTAAVPDTPTNTSFAPRVIDLVWGAYSGGTVLNYEVSATDATGSALPMLTTTTPSKQISGLTPAECYTVTVRAQLSSNDLTGPSDAATFCTRPDVPDVLSLSAPAMGTTQASVTFAAPHSNGHAIDSFKVEVTTASAYGVDSTKTVALSDADLSFAAASGEYTYTAKSLTPGITYQIQVAAHNELGFADLSAAATAQTCESEPISPAPPTFYNHTTHSIGIQWEPPKAPIANGPEYDFGQPITKYKVSYRRVDSPSLSFGPFEGTSYAPNGRLFMEVTDGIEPGRFYEFRVQAYNGESHTYGATNCSVSGSADGWSNLANAFSLPMTTKSDPPEPPQAAWCDAPRGKTLQISWRPNFDNGANITGYTIYSNASASPVVLKEGEPLLPGQVWGEVLQSAFGTLSPMTAYWFEITANNSAGESGRSVRSIIHTSKWVPKVVNELSSDSKTDVSQSQVTVRWLPPFDNGEVITKYEVRFRCIVQAGCPLSNTQAPGDVPEAYANQAEGAVLDSNICGGNGPPCETFKVHTGLSPSTTYEYKIRSYNGFKGFGLNGWSDYTGGELTEHSMWLPLTTSASGPLRPDPPPLIPTVYTDKTTQSTATLGWYVQLSSDFTIPSTPSINKFTVSWWPTDSRSDITTRLITTGFIPGESFEYNVTGLLAAQSYEFSYVAGNIFGDSLATNVSFTTVAGKPSAPGAPTMQSYTESAIVLRIPAARPNGKDVTSYTVQVCHLGKDVETEVARGAVTNPTACTSYTPSTFDTVNGSVTISLDDQTMTEPWWQKGTAFQVTGSATNDMGTSAPSAASVVYTAEAPQAPATPQLGDGVAGLAAWEAIQVVWVPPYSYGKKIDMYEVMMGSAPAVSVPGTQQLYVAAGVVPGSTHDFKVRAHSAYGWSGWSSAASLTAGATVPGRGSAPVYIRSPPDAETYDVIVPTNFPPHGHPISAYQIEDGSGTRTLVDASTRTAALTFTSCPALQAVKYRARANNSAGWGDWSDYSKPVASVCKAGDAPDAPTDLMVLPSPPAGARSFSISWKMPASSLNLTGTNKISKYHVQLTCTSHVCPSNCAGGCPQVVFPATSAHANCTSSPCTELVSSTAAQNLISPNTTYTIRLKAENLKTVLSLGSNVAGPVTTQMAPPDAPPTPACGPPAGCITECPTECKVDAPPYFGGSDVEASSLMYEVQEWETDSDGGWTVTKTTNATRAAPFTITFSREDEPNYRYRARCYNALGPGAWSDYAILTSTYSTYPPNLHDFVVDWYDASHIWLKWVLPVNDRSAFIKFYLTASPVGFSVASSGPGAVLPVSVILAGPKGSYGEPLNADGTPVCVQRSVLALANCSYALSDGGEGSSARIVADTHYRVAIYVKNEEGSSRTEHVDVTTPAAPPDPPYGLRVVSASRDSLAYSWRVPHKRGKRILGYVLAIQGRGSSKEATDTPVSDGRRRALAAERMWQIVWRVIVVSPLGAVLKDSNDDPSVSQFLQYPGGACALLEDDSGANLGFAAYNTELPDAPVTVGGLRSGEAYLTRVFACNGEGGSLSSCLAPANYWYPEDVPAGCNATAGAASPSTWGKPETPLPVKEDQDPAHSELRISHLMLTWTLPYYNGQALDSLELNVSETTYYLAPTETSKNISGLPPATQFPVKLRARNSQGWSDWSETSWATTLPATPARPMQPRCDPKKTNHTSLFINIDEPTSNGQPVTSYDLRVYRGEPPPANDSAAFAQLLASVNASDASSADVLYMATLGPGVEQRNFALTNASVFNLTGGAFNISAATPYTVLVRARNSLGVSAWSQPSCGGAHGACARSCTTPADPGPPFPWMILLVGLGGALALLVVGFYCYWRSNLSKIFAPKMRRRLEKGDPLNDFVSSDMTPMEEQDPELVINPIFIHKIQVQREAERKKKKAKGGLGRTGGLARLGLRIEDRAQVQDERIKDISAVDNYLTRDQGVIDASKTQSAYEKHMASKALLKGQKKAMQASHLTAAEAKAQEKVAAREAARAAMRVDDGQELHGGRMGDAGTSNTAIL